MLIYSQAVSPSSRIRILEGDLVYSCRSTCSEAECLLLRGGSSSGGSEIFRLVKRGEGEEMRRDVAVTSSEFWPAETRDGNKTYAGLVKSNEHESVRSEKIPRTVSPR